MPTIIRARDNQNLPLLPGGSNILPRTYFNLVTLRRNQTFVYTLEKFESVSVVLSGTVSFNVDAVTFNDVGQRKDIWSGNADSVYAPPKAKVEIRCKTSKAEIAIAGGKWPRSATKHVQNNLSPFRISPDEVVMVDVGSVETHSHRKIYHILGKHTEGRSGNLLVSELYADPGCWSGYPPHKHDEDVGETETRFEEVYHFRYDPPTGFGVQIIYQPDGKETLYRTKHGDTVLIDRGYHPTVTTPGHRGYVFTILVGVSSRSLVQNFHSPYRYQMDQIPGIQDMVEKFK